MKRGLRAVRDVVGLVGTSRWSDSSPGCLRISTDCWINQQVTIGDDATVGANATVVKDVPAGAVAVSGPTRILEAGETRGDARKARS